MLLVLLWLILLEDGKIGYKVIYNYELDKINDLLSNRAAGDVAYNIFNTISNTIIAYPAILPIAGGVIAAGVGALVGRKISKSKLKHQNMKLADNSKKLA